MKKNCFDPDSLSLCSETLVYFGLKGRNFAPSSGLSWEMQGLSLVFPLFSFFSEGSIGKVSLIYVQNHSNLDFSNTQNYFYSQISNHEKLFKRKTP